MAEKLGEALLDLRTNDAGFTQGVTRAEGQANRLGQTLDKTKGSSAQLATEMTRTGQSAQQMSAGFEHAGQRVVQSANQQRAGMQQLSFQLNDMATMFALGARPMQIFASQSGQVIQSVQMMMGGTSRLAAFLGGPWGIAITSAVVVLTPFIGKLFEAEDALEGVEFASSKLSDAQDILGSVLEKTTGKIDAQSQALLALARAQAAAGRIGAMQRRAEAEGTMNDIRRGELTLQGGFGGGIRMVRQGDGTEDVVTGFQKGDIGASFAIGSLESRLKAGRISQEAYFRATQAITNFTVEDANVKVFEETQAALNGDAAAGRRILGPQRTRSNRGSRGPRERTEAQKAEDFDNQTFNLERQALQAKLSLATDAEERAAIQVQLLDLEREQRIAEIEASDLGRKRKDALIAQVEALLGIAPKLDEQGNLIVSANIGLEGQVIARERMAQIEREAQLLADEQYNAQRDALQLQLQLADTEKERKAIALQILEAEDAALKAKLEAVIASQVATAAEKQRAQIALDALGATAGTRRAAVGRQNETEVERYMRGLNATPGMINEALDGIKIDGLEALNDGLTDAIMGAENLGQAFKRVADQIIADLLRIAIQQAVIRPLANALFGSEGGGGGGGLFGRILGGLGGAAAGSFGSSGGGVGQNAFKGGKFAGAFARGGTIPTGKFGIVGEEGPELAYAGPDGLGILSNSKTRALLGSGGGAGTTVPITIAVDATGADAAAIARLNARLDRLQSELPGQIVTTVREAKDRRVLP
ncbi:phage tail length tape measure family protein [Erythrobacter sp. WG]|uniref:phage tail length tape measure family protein n=1 Tax=Erythrobacter sp. WG TaxID=2985510 RepID=UPI0022719A7D|nr:phage tail length tape measure family protein [Erythrobacter sp. WG]MCX9146623.1 phage tail length tape measure family protein [Erythrobacter sp. WG]